MDEIIKNLEYNFLHATSDNSGRIILVLPKEDVGKIIDALTIHETKSALCDDTKNITNG